MPGALFLKGFLADYFLLKKGQPGHTYYAYFADNHNKSHLLDGNAPQARN